MASSTLLEVFGHFVFSFTRGVTEHLNPEEPEFTAESFGHNPLESTGLEWYYHPVDELIYQEYSDREDTSSMGYLPSYRLKMKVINACSPEDEETQEDQQEEDRAMAWKRLRPCALQTACKSMLIGALISLLTASLIGTVYLLLSYLIFETVTRCANLQEKLFPVRVQWVRTISEQVASVFYYAWSFFNMLLLFRPYQLKGVKRQLALVGGVGFGLDALYRISLQVVGKPYYMGSYIRRVPLNMCFLISVALQFFLLVRHFGVRPRTKLASSICKMAIPSCFAFIIAFAICYYLYPVFNEQNKEGKLLIAIFAPLFGVALKTTSRICVQRLWNITYPGYSYVLLVPIYFGSAIIFRILQADLGSLQSIAILGIIHGAAEVIERSTMVFIDHICHQLWKRRSAPWGSFRTPRRERLMADIAIMSMLFESTAIVSANGYLYLYQFIYLENHTLLTLMQEFVITTAVPLVIEWFFTSMSLAIETHYQNMPVMAVWRRRWRRYILVAIVNTFPLAMFTSSTMLVIVRGRFHDSASQPCRMPFT